MKTKSSKLAPPRPKNLPFEFVLDLLDSISPITKPMFGCTSIYIEGKIVLILRDRKDFPNDNGVWLATTAEHHESLKKDFPNMRPISLFGPGATGWQVLPMDAEDFEESVQLACKFILLNDARIGKIPQVRSKKKARKYQ